MADELPPVCLLAGGLGTRMGDRVRETPKPLLLVAGQPFLLHQLRLLADHGAHRAVICVGYLGDRIVEEIGSRRFGIDIAYSHDGPELIGTLGAIRKAVPMLGSRFLVLYGDTYLRIDYRATAAAWVASGAPALMTVLRNAGRWDTSSADYENGWVRRYDKRNPGQSMDWIDYGLGGFTSDALDGVPADVSDLSELCHVLAARGELCGVPATERFYEIGTPLALAETERFLLAQTRPA